MPAGTIDEAELKERLANAVASWDAHWRLIDVNTLPGGNSSLTYRVQLASDETSRFVVVKVAPPGVAPVKNRDVLRQARVLRSLEGARGVRVPQVLFEDGGDPPDVPPFFAMTHIEGECFEPILDEIDVLPPPEEIRARELDAAAMLAALHEVRPESVGLSTEPVVTPSEEVDRWVRVFATVDEDLRPRADEAAAALLSSVPDVMDPVVLHGDYRLGNTLARDGEVRAIIDWEIWTVGDPRVDLGWYLMSTHPSKQPTAIREAPGMPSDDELIATYEAKRGVKLIGQAWFDAMTRFKAGAITAQLIKHNGRRGEPDPRVASWRPHVPLGFVDQAISMLRIG